MAVFVEEPTYLITQVFILFFLADDDVRPNCHPRERERERNSKVIKFFYGRFFSFKRPPNGRERYSTPKLGRRRRRKTAGWRERIYELEKNVFFFFLPFVGPLYRTQCT